MPTKPTTFQVVVSELAAAFTRDNPRKVYALRDDAPTWITEDGDYGALMFRVHCEVDGPQPRMPDDWIYEATAAVAGALKDYGKEDADAARDDEHEICDGLVDVYNADRLKWLADHLNNAALCDEAAAELGADADADMFARIGLGQYLARSRIFGVLVSACEAEADSRDEDDEDEGDEGEGDEGDEGDDDTNA